MKTNILKTAFFALMALPVFTSCELDQFPTTAVVDEEIWNNPEDPRKFEVGLIAQFRSIASLGDYIKDIQVDYYQPNVGYGNRNGDTYRWSFGSSDTDDQTGYWASMYSVISQCNYFLSKIGTETVGYEDTGSGPEMVVNIEVNPDLGITEEADINFIKHYVGEAHFLRAYCYYGLAERYCQDYDPATADAELGLPLVTSVDINGRPARATLQATKEFIDKELEMANSLFQFDNQEDLDSWSQSSDENNQKLYKAYRFSLPLPVLQAFEARYSVWAHNYDRALDLADELINNPSFALATSADEFAQMWKYDKGSEFIYVPVENSDERTSYASYHGYNATYSNYYPSYGGWYNPDFIPSQQLIDAYSTDDIRSTVFFEKVGVVFGSSTSLFYDMGGIKLLNKFPGNPDLCKEGEDPAHTYLNAPKPFRIAEQYLIAAEASYMLGNDADARDYLNMLRSRRGLSDTDKSGADLFKDIEDEYYREFVGEGFRLDCLKRWGLGFTRSGAYQRTNSSNGPVIATNVSEISLSVDASDKRFVWEIPTNDIETNPNLGGKNWK